MEFNLIYKNMRLEEIKRMKSLLENKIYTKISDLKLTYAKTKEPVPFSKKNQLRYKPINVNEPWGDLFDCAWFECLGKVPDAYKNENIYVRFDISGEALLVDKIGVPVKGFTNGSSVFDRQYGEPGKRTYCINDFIKPDGSCTLFFDGACNDLFGNYQDNGRIIIAELAIKNDAIERIYYDVETMIDLLLIYKEGSKEYEKCFEDLHRIYQLVEYDEPRLVEKIDQITGPHLNQVKTSKKTIHALGHAHLDLAWLWPIRETKRKLLRTLTNVFYLFEKYPDFTFGFSQPQLLEWLEKESPELFDKVKYYQAQGRFELQGGAWVEMDTNLTGEEAMIRQFLYGMNYYREHFGFEAKSLWLPDVFGYSGNLPQIIKKCGMDYFMTIKISWSLINQFPYHTFNFKGIDGSTVLAHMPPEGNYNSSALAHSFHETQQKYREKDISKDTLLLFGIGDGGGGPGEEHMERIHRNQRLGCLPKIDVLTSADFFQQLEAKRDIYPTHQGELYLENHQGTFTSQSNIKKWNRRLEQKLKAVEYIVAYLDDNGAKTALDRLWKEVLLYQFHDILPGSSIQRVYEETLARYKEIDQELDNLLNSCSKQGIETDLMTADYIFNPLPYDATLYLTDDELIRKVKIKQLSTVKLLDEEEAFTELPYTNTLNTRKWSLTIDGQGEILSYIDLSNNQEYVNQRHANALRVYKDVGDAWNINYSYRCQTPKQLVLKKIQLFESKDFYEYRMYYTFKASTVKQVMRVFKDALYIEFYHDVDWQNLGYMLRTAFDLNITSENAISDIQFGYIARSRALDSTIEKAMLEVPSQQWISIDDGLKGAALLNTSKYGYYIKENLLDMNLLRSTNYPCKDGDIGQTTYQYALFMHDADLNKVDMRAKKMNAAYLGFNDSPVKHQLFTWDNSLVHLSAFKHAYNLDGQILRLYNNSSEEVSTKLQFLRNFYQVSLCNMIEDNQELIGELEDMSLTFKPFEVKTYRLKKTTPKGYYPYHIPRAKTIYYIQKPLDHCETILLSSIQGMLAKDASRLYLASSEAYTDWLNTIVKPKHKIVELSSIAAVMQQFKDDIRGYVIYEAKTTSQNIAATIAGVEGYILVEVKQLDLVLDLNLPFIDAREIDYQTLLDLYKEDLNFDIIIQEAPIYCGLYDIGITLRGIYTSNVKTELIDLGVSLKKDTPILGWVPDDEVIGVTYLSEIDCNMIASNHSLNMSYFMRNKTILNLDNHTIKETVEPNKHYVTFVLSDGDNVQWMMGDYYQNVRTYGHPKRGCIPFGWSVSPSMVDIAPEIIEQYYIIKKDNDLFTSGVSGAGYLYPDQYSQEALESMLDRTEFYYQKLGIEYLAILGTRAFDEDKSSLKAYAKRETIKGGFLYANFDRYKGYNGEIWWENNKPFISARYALWDYENLQELVDKINSGKISPDTKDGYTMIVVHTWSHTYQDVMDIIHKLDSHIQVLLPNTFMEQLQKHCKR